MPVPFFSRLMQGRQTAQPARYAAALLSLLSLVSILTACGTLLGSRDVEIPLTKLQENLDKRFPISNRVFDMFDIRLASPRLSLQPEENRITARFAAVVSPPLTSKTWQGNFSLSGGFRIDAAKNAIFLRDARLEDFSVDGAEPVYKRQIAKLGSLLLDRFVQDTPLYTFSPEQLRKFGTDFTVAKINTRADALVVSFDPVK